MSKKLVTIKKFFFFSCLSLLYFALLLFQTINEFERLLRRAPSYQNDKEIKPSYQVL